MIDLKIKEHCKDCPMFCADSSTDTTYMNNGEWFTVTTIQCISSSMCDHIEEYLRKVIGKENEKLS